jgi:hypothetical protein
MDAKKKTQQLGFGTLQTDRRMSAPLVLIMLGAMPCALSAQPHIALILVDDYGYNDIGYRNARNSDDIRTPVLDRLSAEGVRLENYYVNIACTPVSHVATFFCFSLCSSVAVDTD